MTNRNEVERKACECYGILKVDSTTSGITAEASDDSIAVQDWASISSSAPFTPLSDED
jgi:hypothetical protein